MSVQAKASNDFGLYVHVPFCPSTCDFCAFYQEKPEKGAIDAYLQSIKSEVAHWKEPANTVFWGGGTPGLLRSADIEKLAMATDPLVNRNNLREWTIELAPSTVKPDKIQLLKDLGVTRVSLGVQSFAPVMLERLGRQHSLAQVNKALELVQSAGFTSVNIDLIFAVPGQSLSQWEADLHEAARRQTNHISTYCLTFEEDTALWAKLAKGQLTRDSETEARFYEVIPEILSSYDFTQYEISNFAKQGHECIHNLNTWAMGEWLGLGPAAASQYQDRRWRNVANLMQWQEALKQGKRAEEDIVCLTNETKAADAIVFGLRMNQGIDVAAIAQRFHAQGMPDASFWQNYANEGLLQLNGTRIHLTPQGRLLADAIGSAVLENWKVLA